MKTNTTSPLALKEILLYALAYVLWLVNVVACVVAVIQLRSTVNVLWVALRGDRYSLGSAAHTPAPPSGRISQWLNTVGLTVLLRRFAITTAVPLGLYVASLGMLEVGLRDLH